MRDEPPAQATVVELGLLLGEPGSSPPYFENDKSVPNFKPKNYISFHEHINSLKIISKQKLIINVH